MIVTEGLLERDTRIYTSKEKRVVAVIGLGNIGFPVLAYISKFMPNVVGFDINPKSIERAVEHGLRAISTFPKADTYVVTVNTWWRNCVTDVSAVDSTCKNICEQNKNALVLLESTLAVGTSRLLSKKYGLKYVAACPHRWWSSDEDKHGVSQLRVIGALNNQTLLEACAFYRDIEIPIHSLSSIEYAEISKLVENTNRYLQIAFAEMVKRLADKKGLSFEEIRDAANTKWNVSILDARDGIGGECLPKDIQFLRSLLPDSPLLNGCIAEDTEYKNHISEMPKTCILEHKKKECSRKPAFGH
jgi:nucleotide sugar dehydrogenase